MQKYDVEKKLWHAAFYAPIQDFRTRLQASNAPPALKEKVRKPANSTININMHVLSKLPIYISFYYLYYSACQVTDLIIINNEIS